jgi:hypothetical protein
LGYSRKFALQMNTDVSQINTLPQQRLGIYSLKINKSSGFINYMNSGAGQ